MPYIKVDGKDVYVPDDNSSSMYLYVILVFLFFMVFGGGGWYYNKNYSDAAILAKSAAASANSANASAKLAVNAAAGANSAAANNSANNAVDTAGAATVAAAVANQAAADSDLVKAKKANDDANALAEATRKSLETTMNILKGVDVTYYGAALGAGAGPQFDFYCNETKDDYINKTSFNYGIGGGGRGISNVSFECKSGKKSPLYGTDTLGDRFIYDTPSPFNRMYGRDGWAISTIGPNGNTTGGNPWDFNCPVVGQVIKGVSGMSGAQLGKIGFRCAPNAV